jgi:hypothetical protein
MMAEVVVVKSPIMKTTAVEIMVAASTSEGASVEPSTMEFAAKTARMKGAKSATVESSAAKAASMEAAATTTKTATAETAATVTATSTAATTTSECHGWRGQSSSSNGQQQDCSLSQHHQSPFENTLPSRRDCRWRLFSSNAISVGITPAQLDASLS